MAVVKRAIGGGGSGNASGWVSPEQESWVVRVLLSARVRVLLIGLIAVLGGAMVWYRVVVVPELSAVRYELWVAGSENDLRINVDRDRSVVHITGAPSGLPELVLADRVVYIRDGGLGASEPAMGWVEIPLSELDIRYQALTADRIGPAISRGVKNCESPSPDAFDVIDVLLPFAPPRTDDYQICERYVGLRATQGRTVLVSESKVRPEGIGELAVEQAVSYLEVSDSDAVLTQLAVDR